MKMNDRSNLSAFWSPFHDKLLRTFLGVTYHYHANCNATDSAVATQVEWCNSTLSYFFNILLLSTFLSLAGSSHFFVFFFSAEEAPPLDITLILSRLRAT